MWRTERLGNSIGLPVAVPAVLIYDDAKKPILTLKDNDGEVLVYPPAETQAEGFGSILVLSEPSFEQVKMLTAAIRRGYPIEPRIAGKPFQAIEGL